MTPKWCVWEVCVCCVKGALARGVSERRAYLVNVETSDAQSSQSIFETVREICRTLFSDRASAGSPPLTQDGRPGRSARGSRRRGHRRRRRRRGQGRQRERGSARQQDLRPAPRGRDGRPARSRRSPRHVRRTRAATRHRNRRGTSTSSTISSGSSTPSWGPAYRPCRNDRRLRQPVDDIIIKISSSAHPPRSRPINPRRPMRTPRAYPRPWTGAATAATAAAAAARHSWPTPARRRRAAGSTGALHART